MSSHPSLCSCKHSHLSWYPLQSKWLQCVREELSTIRHESTSSLAPVCVFVCVCVSEQLFHLYDLLTRPLHMLLCTPTPWCYISHCISCLFQTACVVRPEWNDDMTMSYRCRYVVMLCLYSQLALNELWLKWWYNILCHDLFYPLYWA